MDEETSRDREVKHTTEDVGYLAWDLLGEGPTILHAAPTEPPVALEAAITTSGETPVVVDLEATGDGPLTFTITDLPANGQLFQTADGITAGAEIITPETAVENPAGLVLFRPAGNVHGQDEFTFRVSNTAGASSAAVSLILDNDDQLRAILPEENIVVVAEGRIGNNQLNGDFELDLGQSTGAPAEIAQYEWESGVPVSFTFSVSAGGAASFEVVDEEGAAVRLPVSGTFNASGDFDTIFVRTFASKADSSVEVSDLVLDGEDVGNSSAHGADGLGILWIDRPDLIADGFTLTGNATLAWDEANMPLRSHLAFQIKVGDRAPLIDAFPARETNLNPLVETSSTGTEPLVTLSTRQLETVTIEIELDNPSPTSEYAIQLDSDHGLTFFSDPRAVGAPLPIGQPIVIDSSSPFIELVIYADSSGNSGDYTLDVSLWEDSDPFLVDWDKIAEDIDSATLSWDSFTYTLGDLAVEKGPPAIADWFESKTREELLDPVFGAMTEGINSRIDLLDPVDDAAAIANLQDVLGRMDNWNNNIALETREIAFNQVSGRFELVVPKIVDFLGGDDYRPTSSMFVTASSAPATSDVNRLDFNLGIRWGDVPDDVWSMLEDVEDGDFSTIENYFDRPENFISNADMTCIEPAAW